jgi:hypothetical protein
MLNHIDATHAKVRIAGLDEQIKGLREQIKRLEKKKAIYKNAASNSAEDSAVDTQTDD